MEKDKEKAKRRARKYRKRFLIKLVLIIIIVFILCTQIICIRRFSEYNMFPSIKEGDLVIAYRLGTPSPGDAVIYKDSAGKERYGRITASAGMNVDINDDGYFIDGYHPAEEIFYPTETAETGIGFPLTVKEDEFFVLNDFRVQKDDSRVTGCIKKSDIIGKVVFILRRRGI